MSPQLAKRDARDWLWFVVVVLGIVLTIAVSNLNGKLDTISSGDSPASVAAKRSRAESRFLLCSRNLTVVDESKAAEVDAVCAGYQTLADAYESEGVDPPPESQDP